MKSKIDYIAQKHISPEAVELFLQAMPLAERRCYEFLGADPLSKLEEELLFDLNERLNELLGISDWGYTPLFVVDCDPPESCTEQGRAEWRASQSLRELLLKEISGAIH